MYNPNNTQQNVNVVICDEIPLVLDMSADLYCKMDESLSPEDWMFIKA